MPVIGRLDEQVEEVLIAPLSKKQAAGESLSTGEHDSAATATASAREEATPREGAADAVELPVWLL